MLMSIPVISPIDVTLHDAGVRRLPAPEQPVPSDYPEFPDYEVHSLAAPLATAAVVSEPSMSAARDALVEIEHAAQISEYHDFSWWDERLRIIRAALTAAEGQR